MKILEGNPGRRPLPTNTPKPQPVAPKIPRGIAPEARKVWKSLGPHLERMGLLTQVDGPAFLALCSHYALMFEAIKAVQEDGIRVVDEYGMVRKHPLLQVVRDNSAALRQWATEFGLTPSSRSRMTLLFEHYSLRVSGSHGLRGLPTPGRLRPLILETVRLLRPG